MSQAFDQIVDKLRRISDDEKQSLCELLAQQLQAKQQNGAAGKRLSTFGWAKGRIKIADDFDAPLDDFKDYVE